MGSGLLNTSKPNTAVINGSDFHALVDSALVSVAVNPVISSLLNVNMLNSVAINGIMAAGVVAIQQIHGAAIDDATISVAVQPLAHLPAPLNGYPVNARPVNGDILPTESDIKPTMFYLASPQNAHIVVACPKVRVSKGMGGHLFVTVQSDTETYRFSFEGVKA